MYASTYLAVAPSLAHCQTAAKRGPSNVRGINRMLASQERAVQSKTLKRLPREPLYISVLSPERRCAPAASWTCVIRLAAERMKTFGNLHLGESLGLESHEVQSFKHCSAPHARCNRPPANSSSALLLQSAVWIPNHLFYLYLRA